MIASSILLLSYILRDIAYGLVDLIVRRGRSMTLPGRTGAIAKTLLFTVLTRTGAPKEVRADLRTLLR